MKLTLILVVMAAAAALLLENSPAMAAQFCGHDPAKLMNLCKEFLKKDGPKVDPSKACCAEVVTYDIKCVCKNIPQSMMRMISMEKAVFVARRCGLNVPSGMKCGNYVVPMAA